MNITPKKNTTNLECVFCNKPTVPLFQLQRYCPPCENKPSNQELKEEITDSLFDFGDLCFKCGYDNYWRQIGIKTWYSYCTLCYGRNNALVVNKANFDVFPYPWAGRATLPVYTSAGKLVFDPYAGKIVNTLGTQTWPTFGANKNSVPLEVTSSAPSRKVTATDIKKAWAAIDFDSIKF